MRLSTVAGGVTSGLVAVVVLAGPAMACPATAARDAAIAPGAAVGVSQPVTDRRWPFARQCSARRLSGVVEPPGAGAGQRYSRLVVTNTGRRTCVLFGYSRLRLQAADGTPLPTTLSLNTNPGPSLVILAPGERAAANLHWGVIPGTGEPVDQPCEPTPAWLWVWPPHRFRPFPVSWTFGPVCQHGLIDLSAYYRI
ncbi:MAG TPA: DUF4232 domain-containing protein [Mycobacteriales bacterium]|nr:DUF4232 domain-containing protein [Mycobacteriales bacterium]